MATRTEGDGFDLEDALARLAAEAEPSQALQARVLADAAMVGAERRPASARNRSAVRRYRGMGGLLPGRARWATGVAVTIGLAVAVALGYRFASDKPMQGGRMDDAVLSQFSPLDRLERDVIATLDADLLDPDMPL